jgi:hypothetical protein
VRLGEQQHAGDAHAVAKMMKMRGERGRASDISGALEQRLQRVGIGEQGGVAVVEVKQSVSAGGVGHVQSGAVGDLYIHLSARGVCKWGTTKHTASAAYSSGTTPRMRRFPPVMVLL